MLGYAPVGTANFGDVCGAAMALEAKYLLDGASRMQGLHDLLASLKVTAAEKYYPGRVIQELRRISIELGALGDVVTARKTHAFFRAIREVRIAVAGSVMAAPRNRKIQQLVQHSTMPCKFVKKLPLKMTVRG